MNAYYAEAEAAIHIHMDDDDVYGASDLDSEIGYEFELSTKQRRCVKWSVRAGRIPSRPGVILFLGCCSFSILIRHLTQITSAWDPTIMYRHR